MRCWLSIIMAFLLAGCTRVHYRRQADREAYDAIAERNTEPEWTLPKISIDTPRQSRLHDPSNPDRPPHPPDDPAAHRYMHLANGIKGYRRWHRDGDAPAIEDPTWRESLPIEKDGSVILTPDRAVELGLLHSREYQTESENLYLAALTLTLNRFEFALRWFAGNQTTFTHFGRGPTESNDLTTTSRAGFSRTLAGGGQLLVDFANSYMFHFNGPDSYSVSSNFLINLIQPVLRGAGKQVRMENLTQAERNLLYEIRRFARFRKQFSFNIATQQYLSLLLQEQSIRNLRSNQASLQRDYDLHEALLAIGTVSRVKADQVFQQLQQRRRDLIRSEAALESDLDQYKQLLGLPLGINLRLDDSLLAPFALTDPALGVLQEEIEAFHNKYRQMQSAPALAELRAAFTRLKELMDRASAQAELAASELVRWRNLPPEEDGDKSQAALERRDQQERSRDIENLRGDFTALSRRIDQEAAALAEAKRKEHWEKLLAFTRDLAASTELVYVVQTQVRVYLIRLAPQQHKLDEAVDYARTNRLDLMNARAAVTDAWRNIQVSANALEAGLDIVFNANIATPPGGKDPFDFRAAASSYSVGLRLDGPLNRLAERNEYRASLIRYQRARRRFMALEDEIESSIRRDLRRLRVERLDFEIARQRLIAAVRQVEAAREELQVSTRDPDPTSTQNILRARDDALSAKNELIGNWVSYEVGRIQLLLGMEALQLDERGLYTDEHQPRTNPGPATTPSTKQRPPQSAQSQTGPACTP